MSKNESTKYSPYFIMYGRDPVPQVDTLLQPRLQYTGEDYVPTMFEHLHNAYTQAAQNMQEARERNKALIAQSAKPSDFKPGDLVYYFDPSVQPGNSAKFTLPWKSHVRVISKLGEENCCIKNMHTGKTKIVHSENLRFKEENDVWNRTYSSVQIGIRSKETPQRQQPLRATRFPFGDQLWYSNLPEDQNDDSISVTEADADRNATELQGEDSRPNLETALAVTGDPSALRSLTVITG